MLLKKSIAKKGHRYKKFMTWSELETENLHAFLVLCPNTYQGSDKPGKPGKNRVFCDTQGKPGKLREFCWDWFFD